MRYVDIWLAIKPIHSEMELVIHLVEPDNFSMRIIGRLALILVRCTAFGTVSNAARLAPSLIPPPYGTSLICAVKGVLTLGATAQLATVVTSSAKKRWHREVGALVAIFTKGGFIICIRVRSINTRKTINRRTVTY